jgi:hypothetical protein
MPGDTPVLALAGISAMGGVQERPGGALPSADPELRAMLCWSSAGEESPVGGYVDHYSPPH